MTAVTFTYIAVEKIGFSLPYAWGNAIGIGAAAVALAAFFIAFRKPVLKEVGAE
jgi:hypothetical protein